MERAKRTKKGWACAHGEALGTRYGDPISAARQAELRAVLDGWKVPGANHGTRRGPFDRTGLDVEAQADLTISGADVCWLAEQAREQNQVEALFDRDDRSLDKLNLRGADLLGAHLEGAELCRAHLEGADLREAHLEGANLRGAHLEGADLEAAHLEGVDLRGAVFDGHTILAQASLGPGALADWLDRHVRFRNRNAALADVKWGDADMTAVPWARMGRLGDERWASPIHGVTDRQSAERAYRQVTARLRQQGMADAADHFAYRAQIRRRDVQGRTLHLLQYGFSWILAILAGYGYRPVRTLFWYIVVIAGFAWGYVQVTHGAPVFGLTTPSGVPPLQWYEALVLSVSSFHGRGFFQPLQNPGDPVAILAAAEAVLGLFIEISFIATFTQRYLGNR